MKGLIGAATVMGSLMYGAGHCWNGMINMHLRESSLEECLSDNQFLSFLDHDDVPPDLTAQRRYPPVALIECVADLTQTHYKVRRPASGHCRPMEALEDSQIAGAIPDGSTA